MNSKSNQITFFFSGFDAQHDYEVEFHVLERLAKLKSDKYFKNRDFVE